MLSFRFFYFQLVILLLLLKLITGICQGNMSNFHLIEISHLIFIILFYFSLISIEKNILIVLVNGNNPEYYYKIILTFKMLALIKLIKSIYFYYHISIKGYIHGINEWMNEWMKERKRNINYNMQLPDIIKTEHIYNTSLK